MPQPEERKRKTLIGIVATAVITAAAVVVLLVAPIAPRLTLTRLETVDRDFDGIFTDRTKTSESKTIRHNRCSACRCHARSEAEWFSTRRVWSCR